MFDFEQTNLLISKSQALTEADKSFLLLYNKVMNQNHETTEQERDVLSKTLVTKLEDKAFSAKLSQLKKELKKGVDGVSAEFPYLDIFKTFFNEAQNRYLSHIAKKALIASSILEQGGTLEEHEKLSLSEINLLNRFTRLKRCFDIFELKKISINTNENYVKLKRSCETLTALPTRFFDSALYQSGDIVMTDSDKTESFGLKHLHTGPIKEKIFYTAKRFFTRYGHAAQLTQINKELKQSHIWGKHQIDDFSFKDVVESDIYRVNVIKLVDPAQVEQLKALLGEQWEHELQTLYATHIAEISAHSLLKGITIIGGIESAKSLLPSSNDKEKHKHQGLFFQPSSGKTELTQPNMICSDFVARETAEAIKMVNESLNAKGLTNPLRSPFPEGINFASINPDSLIRLLKRANCVIPVESSKLFSILNTKNPKYLSDSQVRLTTALYEKVEKLAPRSETSEAFVAAAKVAFLSYLEANEVLSPEIIRLKKKKIEVLLNDKLPQLFKQHTAQDPEGFVEAFFILLKQLLKLFGFKDKVSQQIITQTVHDLKTIFTSNDEVSTPPTLG